MTPAERIDRARRLLDELGAAIDRGDTEAARRASDRLEVAIADLRARLRLGLLGASADQASERRQP